MLNTRCPCGINIIWPRNVCCSCGRPTTPEQRDAMQPQPLTEAELDSLERELTQPSRRIQTGSKNYAPEKVLRLLLTIRTMQRPPQRRLF